MCAIVIFSTGAVDVLLLFGVAAVLFLKPVDGVVGGELDISAFVEQLEKISTGATGIMTFQVYFRENIKISK